MKISARKYASALIEILEESKDQPASIRQFLSLLWRRKQFRLLPKIVLAFQDEWNRRHGLVQLDAWYPQRFETALAGLKDGLQKSWGKEVEITGHVQNELIGGWKIRHGDTLIDASIQSKLKKFQSALI